MKSFGLIPSVQYFPHASKKPKATPTGVVVSSMVEAVLATLECLQEAIEDGEEPPMLFEDEQVTLVVLGSNSSIGGRVEGSRGSGGRDEPIDSDLEP